MIAIKNRYTGAVMHTVADATTIKEAVVRLVQDGMSLRGADLRDADLTDADLTDADLSGADLSGADLSGADGEKLEIPVIPNIDAAILAAVKTAKPKDGRQALRMSDWHTCESAHCRAGWAIHLAGKPGYDLETSLGAATAGALIYAASRPDKRVPDFYCGDEMAMADIIKCAAEEEEGAKV